MAPLTSAHVTPVENHWNRIRNQIRLCLVTLCKAAFFTLLGITALFRPLKKHFQIIRPFCIRPFCIRSSHLAFICRNIKCFNRALKRLINQQCKQHLIFSSKLYFERYIVYKHLKPKKQSKHF